MKIFFAYPYLQVTETIILREHFSNHSFYAKQRGQFASTHPTFSRREWFLMISHI